MEMLAYNRNTLSLRLRIRRWEREVGKPLSSVMGKRSVESWRYTAGLPLSNLKDVSYIQYVLYNMKRYKSFAFIHFTHAKIKISVVHLCINLQIVHDQ